MRPVVPDKGGKGNPPNGYPYDLTSNFNNPWPNAFASGEAVETYFGTQTPTMQETLDLMVLQAKVSNSQLPKPTGKQAINTRRRQLDCTGEIATKMNVYQKAAPILMRNLGETCAYCEIFNNGGFDVEHCAPISQYPPYGIVWDNFLLSCKPCNEGGAKGNKPSRSYVKAKWLTAPPNPTEAQYYQQVRNDHYIWPDLDDFSYTAMAPGLFYKNGAGWTEIPLARAILTDQYIYSRDPATRTVMAYVYKNAGAMTLEEVSCQFVGRATYAKEANRMIKLCRLNVKQTGPSPTFDRRMYIRTTAWFTVLSQLKTLRNQDAGNFDDAWTAMLETARTTGSYSTWVQVFNQAGDTDPTNTTFVGRFVATSNSDDYFPNTNTIGVP